MESKPYAATRQGRQRAYDAVLGRGISRQVRAEMQDAIERIYKSDVTDPELVEMFNDLCFLAGFLAGNIVRLCDNMEERANELGHTLGQRLEDH